MLPRFSIKIALIVMTVGGVLSVALAAAVRGDEWAIGVMVAIVSAPVMLLFHAFFYGLARLAGLLTRPRAPLAPVGDVRAASKALGGGAT